MKKFLIRFFLFSSILLSGILFVFFLADGKSDPYYLRFTTGRQSSLIIGTSRAAQGLQPTVFDEILYKNTGRHFFNYSFSLIESPFGPAYFKSIQRKLDPDTKDGIFIIAVDPWSVSSTAKNPNDSAGFSETKSFMGKTKYVNLNPNIPYLINSYDEPYVHILKKWKSSPALYLHKDGWLEVNTSLDSMAKSMELKMAFYRNNYLPVYKFSTLRLYYLSNTISFLQKHGRVYLVRLPVHQRMFDMEDELMPDFDDKISGLAKQTNVKYLNFKLLKNNYDFVDGHHLYKTSGKRVSAFVAEWVVQSQ